MRGGHHLVQLHQRVVRARRLVDVHVQRRPGHLALLQGLGQVVLVDDAAAGAVDDAHAGLHLRDGLAVDEPARFLDQGHVDGDEVGPAVDLVEAGGFHAHARGGLRRDEGVVAQHLHAQPQGSFGHDAPYVPQAYDSEGLVAHLHARELLPVPAAGLERCRRLGNVPRQGQHERDGVFAGGDVVAPRRVHHHDALLAGSVHVDVLHAHAGAADDPEPVRGRDDLRGHLGAAANDQPLVSADDFLELFGREPGPYVDIDVRRVVQNREPHVGKRIGNQHLHHATSTSVRPRPRPDALRWSIRQGISPAPPAGSPGPRPHPCRE